MNSVPKRIDEIDRYYQPIKKIGKFSQSFFWSYAFLSFFLPYSSSLVGKDTANILQIVFLILVLIYFALSNLSSLYYFPEAEFARRKQLLSNSFGTLLSLDQTSRYYNNDFTPSINRLGANTMENALFTQEIAAKMLERKRLFVWSYLLIWLIFLIARHEDLTIITIITQTVFSGEIVGSLLNLEFLRHRSQHTYELLHDYFRNKPNQDSLDSIATVLNAFAFYEAAKSDAGIMLSTPIFKKLNPDLSKRWENISQQLSLKD